MQISIRVARPTDAEGLALVLADLLAQTLSQELKSALNTNFLRLLSTPGQTLLVAEYEAQLLGFVSCWTRWGLFQDSPIGTIDQLIVKSEWQQSSAALALLEQAIGACQAMGCQQLEVALLEGSLDIQPLLMQAGFEVNPWGRYYLEIA